MRTTQMAVLRLAGLLPFSVALLLAAGCGRKDATVKGRVLYQSRPVVWGNVTLRGSDGRTFQGEIDRLGTYQINKVPLGPVMIAVDSPNPEEARDSGSEKESKGKAGRIIGSQNKENAGKAKMGNGRDRIWIPLPRKYIDVMTSGLTGEVVIGKMLDITLR